MLNNLYFLVEGDNDEVFIENAIEPLLTNYFNCKIIQYAQMPKKVIVGFINKFNNDNEHYFFLKDLNSAVCPSERKKDIIKDNNLLKPSSVVIVEKEIEAWYLAGLDAKSLRSLGIRDCMTTDFITKEIFFDMIPKNVNKVVIRSKILKYFSLNSARSKNKSFLYFILKIEGLIGNNLS